MLMRNPEYITAVEQDLESSSEAFSPREILLGQVVLLLLFVIAILLRSLSG